MQDVRWSLLLVPLHANTDNHGVTSEMFPETRQSFRYRQHLSNLFPPKNPSQCARRSRRELRLQFRIAWPLRRYEASHNAFWCPILPQHRLIAHDYDSTPEVTPVLMQRYWKRRRISKGYAENQRLGEISGILTQSLSARDYLPLRNPATGMSLSALRPTGEHGR